MGRYKVPHVKKKAKKKGCVGKFKHTTQDAAYGEMRAYKKKGSGVIVPLNVYKCPICNHWHVGHMIGGRKKVSL